MLNTNPTAALAGAFAARIAALRAKAQTKAVSAVRYFARERGLAGQTAIREISGATEARMHAKYATYRFYDHDYVMVPITWKQIQALRGLALETAPIILAQEELANNDPR